MQSICESDCDSLMKRHTVGLVASSKRGSSNRKPWRRRMQGRLALNLRGFPLAVGLTHSGPTVASNWGQRGRRTIAQALPGTWVIVCSRREVAIKNLETTF
jgi:hypothetical protein